VNRLAPDSFQALDEKDGREASPRNLVRDIAVILLDA
jgi:hypothetical protein